MTRYEFIVLLVLVAVVIAIVYALGYVGMSFKADAMCEALGYDGYYVNLDMTCYCTRTEIVPLDTLLERRHGP